MRPLRLPSTTLVWLVALGAQNASASLCFDFTKPEKLTALSSPIEAKAGEDASAAGDRKEGGGWGAARTLLDMPLSQTFALLKDQTVLKSPDESDIEVEHEKRAGLADFQRIAIKISPFPLVKIRWTEEWAYRVVKGTDTAPEEVLIAYQKTAGTDHIKHFCGNIWLKPGPGAQSKKTDFAVYEEAEATRRNPTDIAKGHLGTIRTIKARAALENAKPADAKPAG